MKKKLIFTVLMLLTLSFQNLLAQQYLNPNSTSSFSSGSLLPGSTFNGIYFDLFEINTSCLDASTNLSSVQGARGDWFQSNCNGTFGSTNNFYSFLNFPAIRGSVAVDLNNDSKKDQVVLNDNDLNVYKNQSAMIFQQTVSGGGGSFIDAGMFDYSDGSHDVAIVNNGNVRIYKNNGDGNLQSTPINNFNLGATKVKVRQMTIKDEPYKVSDILDKWDLIVYNGSTLTVYKNNGANGINSTPMASFDVGFQIFDIDVGDLNFDGYNDVVAVGGSYPNFTAKFFPNLQGVLVYENPSWTVTSSTSIYATPRVKIVDINRDGMNDILFCSYEGLTSYFLNTTTGLNTTSQQTFLAYVPLGSVYELDVADLYNQGGQALVFSHAHSSGNIVYYGTKIVNATTINPNPVPPLLEKDYFQQGSLYRPKLILNNRKERDFQKYHIYKKRPGNPNYNFLAETTLSEYIDYSEYIIFDDGLPGNDNCFYKAQTIDLSNKISEYSNIIGFHVGTGGPPPNEENMYANELVVGAPEEYSLFSFPNPFNPVSKIVYTIPKSSFVNIKIFDMSGRLIKELVNETKIAGTYTIDFNGSDLSSGMYYLVLNADKFQKTEKLVLMK